MSAATPPQRGERRKLRAGGPAVVAIGGGHGLARSLGATRRFAGVLTAIVSAADDGGSSGRLRASLEIPAPGDLRKAIGALLVAPERTGPLLEHRFGGGELAGHAFGNLLLAALTATAGDFAAAIADACELLGTLGAVYPATSEPVSLIGETASASIVGQVAVMATPGLVKVRLDPAAPETPAGALEALGAADLVVLGPGSLYTSVLAALAAPALCEAVRMTPGRVVYVANLQEQHPETSGYDLGAHLAALLAHHVRVDAVLADPNAAVRLGELPAGTEVHLAEVARQPDGLVHDEARLADALARLLEGTADRAGKGPLALFDGRVPPTPSPRGTVESAPPAR